MTGLGLMSTISKALSKADETTQLANCTFERERESEKVEEEAVEKIPSKGRALCPDC